MDDRRLPKAIQSVLRDYRGEQVRLPEEQVPAVLTRLAGAAARQGRMPHQDATPASIYQALHDTLDQMRLNPVVAGPAAAAMPVPARSRRNAGPVSAEPAGDVLAIGEDITGAR